MFLLARCCKFLVVGGVLFFPPRKSVNPAGLGPHDKSGKGFGAGVVEQDVNGVFGAGLDAVAFFIRFGAQVSKWHGVVQGLQELPQHLVGGRFIGEGEFAEGGHYGAVREASSALVSLVV